MLWDAVIFYEMLSQIFPFKQQGDWAVIKQNIQNGEERFSKKVTYYPNLNDNKF